VSPEEAVCTEPQRAAAQPRSRPWTPGRNQKKQANVARGYLSHVNAAEAEEAPDVVLGTFLINSMPVKILFDSGASHSFITESFVDKGSLKPSRMDRLMIVQIPGSTPKTRLSCRNVPVDLHGVQFQADLIILGTKGLDVVLGMDWMSKYQGHIDCARKAITVTSSDGVQIEHIATMPSRKAYYKKSISGPTLDQVPVVCEYPDVFPEEFPGMPPDQDIEFIIELIPGTTPIAQRPYRINTQELEELKKQLTDMLSKGLIRLIRGCPIFSVSLCRWMITWWIICETHTNSPAVPPLPMQQIFNPMDIRDHT
jgi:hypothetical protein